MAAYRADFSGGGSGGTGNRAVTVTPAVGDFCIVQVVVAANTNLTPTMSDNNSDASTYTLIRTARKAASADTTSVFVRDKLFSNTTSTIITAATGSNTAGELTSIHITGMSKTGAGAVRQSAIEENQASGGTPAPAFAAAALTGNMTIGMVGNATNPATLTTPSGWTEQADVGQASPATGLETVTRDSGFTGTTVTWGSTSASAFCSIILELDNNPVIEEEDTFWGTFNRNVVMGIAATMLTSSILTASIGQQIANGDPADSGVTAPPPEIVEGEYWNNSVWPVAPSIYRPLPYLPDAQDDPAGALMNAPGTTDDYWQIVQDQHPYKQYGFSEKEDGIVPQPAPANPDEDYWGTPGSTAPPDLYPETLFLPFPLGGYAGDVIIGYPEEDYWQNWTRPVPASMYQQLPYLPAANEDTPPLFGVFEEDFNWSMLLGPPWPVAASQYLKFPIVSEDPFAEVVTPGLSEEDYWINPVAAVPLTLYQSFPYLPDGQDDTAGALFGTFEDDSWQNPVLPVQAKLYQALPYNPDPEELVFSFASIEEDYWISPVPVQVQQSRMGPIYFWDEGEIALFIVIAEEDYWQQLVAPVPVRMYQRFPLLPDLAANQYIFFGEMQVTSISAEPLVTMDISAEPLIEMSIKMLKWKNWES